MRFRFGFCLFLASLVAIGSLAHDATFRADIAHDGVYDAAGAPQLSGIKWKFHTGGQVYSSPTVADRRCPACPRPANRRREMEIRHEGQNHFFCGRAKWSGLRAELRFKLVCA